MKVVEIQNKAKLIRELVERNELSKAISEIKTFASWQDDNKYRNEIIITASQYSLYSDEKRMNTYNDIQLRNKTIFAFLELIDKIENDLLSNSDSNFRKIPFPPFNKYFGEIRNKEDIQLTNNLLIEKSICQYYLEKSGEFIKDRIAIDMSLYQNSEYKDWLFTKRKFTKSEAIRGTILKLSNTGGCYKVHLHENGTLEESKIRTCQNPEYNKNDDKLWLDGSWELIDGVIVLHIDNYITSIFANRNGIIHYAVEYEDKKMVWYHDVILIPHRTEFVFRILDNSL